MNHFVINMNSEQDKLIEHLKSIEKPYSIFVQRILPKASTQQMRYLWGCCYKIIADHTGHSTLEVHRALMQEYNLVDEPAKGQDFWELKIKSASTFSTVDITEWTDIVAAWAFNELEIHIPSPNEYWINEK